MNAENGKQNSLESKTESEAGGKMVKKCRKPYVFRVYHIAYFMAFFAPFVIMMAIFVGSGIYPFGDRSFLASDMYHQYMPFFQEFVGKIKAGEGISYSWNVGMGSNFLALYVYYLASPLHWLAFLFPQRYLIEFMSYLVVIKTGLAGFSSFLFLMSKRQKTAVFNASVGALFFSCFYAMSGFMAAYNWNIMWLDCVILLPLILMGLEQLVRTGKAGTYCIFLSLCILSNFYISIMICLFLVIYFAFLFVTEGLNWKRILTFAASSLLAGALASVLLIPVVCALSATEFGDITFPKIWESYFSVLDILARHCMGVTTERALEHWPNIYCGTPVFLMVPMYALNEGIPARKRFGMLAMGGIFLLGFGINGLDFIWHGLNYPDSLPARQSFIYILLVLVMAYECFIHLDSMRPSAIVKALLGSAVFFLMVEKFVDSTDFMTWTWLLNLAFVTVYAALLYLYRTRGGWKIYAAVGGLALALVIAECSINMVITCIGTTDRVAYLKPLEPYRHLYRKAAEQEEGFTRFEIFARRTKNDATLAGFPSASLFSSTMNSRVMDFYTRFGMLHSKVYYGYDGATAFTSALLNVGYLFGDSENYENELFELADSEDDIYLYRAKYTLPFGYVAPEGFCVPEKPADNGISLQNELMKQLGIEELLLKRVGTKDSGDDVSFTAPEDGIYYGFVTYSGTKKIEVVGGNPEKRSFKDLKKGCILYLGKLNKDQNILISNGDDEDETPNIVVNVYRLDEEVLAEAIERLGRQHLTEVKVEDTRVTGNLELQQAGRLILTIPYEKGWKVKVNGQERETEIFGDAFLALDLQPGEYRIEAVYVPQGKYEGIFVSLSSAILLLAGVFFVQRKKHKIMA